MAVTQLLATLPINVGLNDGYYLTPMDRWDSEVLPSALINGTLVAGPFQGYCLNWDGYNHISALDSFEQLPYSGYTTNFNGTATASTNDAFVNSPYAGYTTNWGQYTEPVEESVYDVDMDSIKNHPKDQIVYYKLKGWNPNTSNYESWIVSHNITARPSLDGGLFDPTPGNSPPNVERDVFKTPPSGNILTNIIIVAKWLE